MQFEKAKKTSTVNRSKQPVLKSETVDPVPENHKSMSMEMVRDIARRRGLTLGKMKKTEMIKNIQRAEGNFDCFGTAVSGYCDQQNCLWLATCLHMK